MAERRVLEGTVKDAVKRILAGAGVYYFMPPANGYGAMGNFDIVCCVNGRFLGIEVKRDFKEKPTALQTRNAHLAMHSGAIALLIHMDNVGVVSIVVNKLLRGEHPVMSHWPFEEQR